MIELKNVTKSYRMGEHEVFALRGVNLRIEDGDFVAIMGPSGSGKSTLTNILGLLDVPSSGSYSLNGREVSRLSQDDLAVLRRDEIGFVFQQFNLLPRMSAAENVGLPLLYSKKPGGLSRAREILARVGLGPRADHRPNELSGGQQQRVAIARSLINQPRMILADEPTGNLDSQSEKDILGILRELNAQGITVVVVTHEEEIGAQARRLVRVRDGVIHSDERREPLPARVASLASAPSPVPSPVPAPERPQNLARDFVEHLRQGLHTLLANKVRTALSTLGILIGVGAVVAMMALGTGAQQAIESQLSSLGSNLLVLRAGARRVGGVAQEAGSVSRLSPDDADALAAQVPGIRNVDASVNGRVQLSFGAKNWNSQVTGATAKYAVIKSASPVAGRFFTESEDRARSRVALLGATVVKELFGPANPVGEMIKINRVSFQVIGVLPEKGASGFRDQDDVVVIPLRTAMFRLLGKNYVDSIDIEAAQAGDMDALQESALGFMYRRYRVPAYQRDDAFQVRNMAEIQAALSSSSRTMSLLLASIAAISLLVGGIGIMNIMLVSVTERTKEIGLRKAIGARRRDILLQFLAESVVVSVVGGVAGIALGAGVTVVLGQITGWSVVVSPGSVLLSFSFAALIGVVFGIYPARKASMLHPIDALRYE